MSADATDFFGDLLESEPLEPALDPAQDMPEGLLLPVSAPGAETPPSDSAKEETKIENISVGLIEEDNSLETEHSLRGEEKVEKIEEAVQEKVATDDGYEGNVEENIAEETTPEVPSTVSEIAVALDSAEAPENVPAVTAAIPAEDDESKWFSNSVVDFPEDTVDFAIEAPVGVLQTGSFAESECSSASSSSGDEFLGQADSSFGLREFGEAGFAASENTTDSLFSPETEQTLPHQEEETIVEEQSVNAGAEVGHKGSDADLLQTQLEEARREIERQKKRADAAEQLLSLNTKEVIAKEVEQTVAQRVARLESQLQEAKESATSAERIYSSKSKESEASLQSLSQEVEQLKDRTRALQASEEKAVAGLEQERVAHSKELETLYTVIEEKDNEIKKLKLKDYNYPSQILSLQAQIKAQEEKFHSLVDRYNSVKALELARQKRKFAEISKKQKEVFMRQRAKLEQASNTVSFLNKKRADLEEQLRRANEKSKQAQAMLESEASKLQTASQETVLARSDLEKTQQELQTELSRLGTALKQKTSEVQDLTDKLEEISHREETQANMMVYIEGASDPPSMSDRLESHALGAINPSTQWLRSFGGSAFKEIKGATQATYVPNADDVGAVLQVKLCNDEGIFVTAEAGPVMISESLCPNLHEYLNSRKDIQFTVESVPPLPAGKKTIVVVNKEKVKVRIGRKTLVKSEYCPATNVFLHIGSATAFTLVLSSEEKPLIFNAESKTYRDLIMCCVRAFKALRLYGPRDAKQPDRRHLTRLVFEENTEMSKDEREPPVPMTPGTPALNRELSVSRQNTLERGNSESVIDAVIRSPANGKRSSVEYDAEGFIIRKSIEKAEETEENGSGSDVEAPAMEPIVIKPPAEAVEDNPEKLVKMASVLSKPPPAHTSKSAKKKSHSPTAKLAKRSKSTKDLKKKKKRATKTPKEKKSVSRKSGSEVADTPIAEESGDVAEATPQRVGDSVMVAIVENLYYTMTGGVLEKESVKCLGELHLKPLQKTGPDQKFVFSIPKLASFTNLICNDEHVETLSAENGVISLSAMIPPDLPYLPALKYQLRVEEGDIPLHTSVVWEDRSDALKLILKIRTGEKFPLLSDVSLLFALRPDVKTNSPVVEEYRVVEGSEHCKLEFIENHLKGILDLRQFTSNESCTIVLEFVKSTKNAALVGSNISVNFVCADSTLSGIHVVDLGANGENCLALNAVVQKVKTGRVICRQ